VNTFEITIERRNGDAWPVVVVQTQPGSFLPVRTEGILQLDVAAVSREFDPRAYGEALGSALFVGQVRDAFTRGLTAARDSSDKSLRVLLFVEADDLRGLHWERTCAWIDQKLDFLSLHQQTPLSLYQPSQTDRRFPPIGRRDLRALVLVAAPSDMSAHLELAEFDVAATVAGIRTALAPIPNDVLATAAGASGPPTLAALLERVVAERYTMLHIVCHGAVAPDGETILFLPGDDGSPVTGTVFLERLERIGESHGLPQFCFLCTCDSAAPQAETGFGGLAQRLVRELGMPSVLAMTGRISISTAQEFSTAYYLRLREHGEPDRALPEALVSLQGRFDATVPALMSRLGGRPMFSDTADRPLTDLELVDGLDRLPTLFTERAPILIEPLEQASARIRQTLGSDQPQLTVEREAQLLNVRAWCDDVVTVGFEKLALGAEVPAYDSRCPFKGMAAFREADREFFFGREPEVARLAGLLGEHPFLAVLGASGSGKSSLVMAGLLPTLKIKAAVLTPSAEPAARLEQSLASEPDLVVIDQFEELFTLCRDEGQRRAFIERVLALAGTKRVVLTMRADFWGECAPYAELKAEMLAHQELIPPMDGQELRRAMELQAAAVGLRFEADLANTLLDEVQGEPGAMPLLQHALLELWKRRHGRWLRADEYRAIGGVRQAIAHTADEIYSSLEPADRERMQDIFVRLTRLDDESGEDDPARDTRRRVDADELVPAGSDPAATRAMVARLADARLVVTSMNPASGVQEVEVAHEALIRYWPLLKRWLDDGRSNLRLREGIRDAARQWEAGRRSDELIAHRGSRLEDAVRLSREPRFAFNALEQAYVDAALNAQRRELDAARAQRRRRLIFAVVVPGLTLIAIIVSVLAVQANQARRQAEALRLSGDARAAFDSRIDLGLLLAREAAAHSDDLQVQAATLVGLTQGPGPRRFDATGDSITDGQLDRLGSHAVLLRSDSTTLWDVGQQSASATIAGAAAAVAISGDGSTIALARPAGVEIRSWDSPAAPRVTCPVAGNLERVQLSERGDLVVAVTVDREAEPPRSRVTAMATTDCRETLSSDINGLVVAVELDAVDERIALGTEEAGAVVLDAKSGEAAAELLPADLSIRAVALADQDRIAAITSDGDVLLWNSHAGGEPVRSIHVYDTSGTSIRFRPDGSLLTSSLDGQMRVVDPSNQGSPTGPPLRALPDLDYGGGVGMLDVAATEDGAITVDPSGRIVQWDLSGLPPLGPQLVSGVRIDLIEAMAGGSLLAAGANTVWLLDAAGNSLGKKEGLDATALGSRDDTFALGTSSGEILVGSGTLDSLHPVGEKFSSAVSGVAILPDGMVVAVDSDGLMSTTGPSPGASSNRDLAVGITSMATNGSLVFMGATDGRVRVANAMDASKPILQGVGHTAMVTSIAVSPDGRLVASGSDDRSIRLWNVDGSGGLNWVRTLIGHSDKVTTLAFSRDGRWLASSGEDHQVIVWDVDSGTGIGDPIAVSGVPGVDFAVTTERKLLVTTDGLAEWDMWPEAWSRIACSIIGDRSFDGAESQRYLRGERASGRCD
jgi:WD40 repeat protein